MNITDKEIEFIKDNCDINISKDLNIKITDEQLSKIANDTGESLFLFRINYLIMFNKYGNEKDILKNWIDKSCECYDIYTNILLNFNNDFNKKTKWILSKITFDDQYMCSYCLHKDSYNIVLGVFNDYKKAYEKVLELLNKAGCEYKVSSNYYQDEFYFYFTKDGHILYDSTYFYLRKFDVLLD